MSTNIQSDWERLLLADARFQWHFPGYTLVGGTASAVHTGYRFSNDADYVLMDMRSRFDHILEELESVECVG